MLANEINFGILDPAQDFVYFTNWFDKKYKKKLDGRWATIKVALNLMLQRGRNTIFESGCQRMADDWGAGASTTIFCEFFERYGGHLWSIDNNARHLAICDELTKKWAGYRTLVESDSVAAFQSLNKLPGAQDVKPGIIFLDSYDYPIFEIWNEFGGRVDLPGAIARVAAIPEKELLAQFGHLIDPCQEHCLKELKAVLPYCDEQTILLIDDNLDGGGKGRTAKKWLTDSGNYECIIDHQQSLWIHR